jgi:hypothetical protein
MNVPTERNADELVAEALRHPAVSALYSVIEAKTPISIEAGAAERTWGSKTSDGKTAITVTPTKHPAAALFHELLHAKLKLGGYRQYSVWVCMDEPKLDYVISIGEALDNELQHHRMIKEFLDAGFEPEEFYHDDDVDALKHARRGVQGLKKSAAPEEFLLPYMTIIAPAGLGTAQQKNGVRNMFKANSSPAVWEILTGVERAFADWSAQGGLDAGDTIVNILRLIGGYDRTWVGVSQEGFPTSGQFIGQPFTAQDAIARHNKRNNSR